MNREKVYFVLLIILGSTLYAQDFTKPKPVRHEIGVESSMRSGMMFGDEQPSPLAGIYYRHHFPRKEVVQYFTSAGLNIRLTGAVSILYVDFGARIMQSRYENWEPLLSCRVSGVFESGREYSDSILADWGYTSREGAPMPGSLLGIEVNFAPDVLSFLTPKQNAISFLNPRIGFRVVSGNDIPSWRLNLELLLFKYALRF